MEMNQKQRIEKGENNAGLDLYIETAPNVKLYVKDYGRKTCNSYSWMATI
jgi:hypothetical protein